MKKILLAITLILGINQAIQPSLFSKAFQSVKSTLTPANLLTYTILPTLGTGIAYHFAGKEVASQLGGTQAQLAQLSQGLEILQKKDSHWYDSLGTAGAVIGGTLTAYRFLQYGISEFSSFMQIMGLINSLKNNAIREPAMDKEAEKYLAEQPEGPRKLRPAKRN